MDKVLYSSNSVEWATPQDFFDQLNNEFNFSLDPCATHLNHKCQNYYTIEDNGLLQDWSNNIVFCNPPYGRDMFLWIKKCYDEWKKNNITIVLLLPVRTDTKWFHEFIYNNCEIRFIRGRLKFGNSSNVAPFPSMVCIFKERNVKKW